MPITKSAKKTLRSSKRKQVFNLRRKRTITSEVKGLKKLVEEKKIDEAEKALSGVFKALDKAAKNGVIKKNNASRKKSRLSRLVSKNK